MKQFKLLSVFLCSLIIGAVGLLWHSLSTHYCVCIPVQYDKQVFPMIQAQIEDRPYTLALRIGARFPLFLSKEALGEMKKTPHGTTEWQDLKDIHYKAPSYLIPKITIGDLTLTDVIATESPSDEKDADTLGKYLGGEFNLLLDFPHSRIIACHSFAKLKSKGFANDQWIQVPFTTSRIGVILEIDTDLGLRRFSLSTTLNVSVMKESLLVPNQTFVSSIFYIGKRKFTNVHLEPLPLPECLNEVDGFISMDFLKKNAIYLDYTNKIAYIEPPQPYFEYLPVTFAKSGMPLIDISVEEKNYSIGFDLGYRFPFSFGPTVLDAIHKTPYGTASWGDYKGNTYTSPAYTIPLIKVCNLTFSDVIVNQNNQEFYASVSAQTSPYHDIGVMGRPILEKYNLFLDFPHSAIYAATDYHRLQKAGLLSKHLLKIPFILHPDGILLSAKTDAGEKKLILDTGASHTCARSPQPPLTSHFYLGNHDFGSRSIISIDLHPRFSYDGYLGMDFLTQHPIFIDYENKFLVFDLSTSE